MIEKRCKYIGIFSVNIFTKKEHHDMDDSPWEDLMGEKNDKNKRK